MVYFYPKLFYVAFTSVLYIDCCCCVALRLHTRSRTAVSSLLSACEQWSCSAFILKTHLVCKGSRVGSSGVQSSEHTSGEGHPSQKEGRHENSTVVYILCSSQVQRKHGLLMNSLFALMLKNSACKDCRQHDGNCCCCCLDTSPGHLKLTRGFETVVCEHLLRQLWKNLKHCFCAGKSSGTFTSIQKVLWMNASDVSDRCAKEASESTTNEWFTFRRNWREPNSYGLSELIRNFW